MTRGGAPSVFFVITNLGMVSVQLSGSMSKLDLLKALEEGLIAQDRTLEVWVDSELEMLFVLLDATEGIIEIGAGSSDEGLTASCKVQLIE